MTPHKQIMKNLTLYTKERTVRIRNFGAHFFVCLVETLGTTRNLSGRRFFTGRHKKQNNKLYNNWTFRFHWNTCNLRSPIALSNSVPCRKNSGITCSEKLWSYSSRCLRSWVTQFVIFNPWKLPWNWIVFYQNSFVVSPD